MKRGGETSVPVRVVVAVDPPATTGGNACGIIAAGAALYEQGRVHHVAAVPELEEELLAFEEIIEACMTSIISRLRAAFGRPPETRACTRAMFELHPLGEPHWRVGNPEAFAREGFAGNPVGYRCVSMIAQAVASIPWLAYAGEREVEDHPVLALLRRPNPGQSGGELLEALIAHLQISGNGWLRVLLAGREPAELHVLHPGRVRIITDDDGWPVAWEYTTGGCARRIVQEADDPVPPVMQLRLFSPERLKRELEEAHAGMHNAGRPMVLEGGLEWTPFSLAPRDMEHIEMRHAAARDIALAFGVPPMLLGIPGDNTYSNYAEANRVFWRQTVLPLARRLAESLTGWLAPAWGGDLRLDLDTDAVEALSGERDALWSRLREADFLTINEKREAVGYSPVEGGDVLDRATTEERS